MNFVRNTAGLLLTSSVMIPIGFVTSVLLARYLSPDDRGIYSVATSFAVLAAVLAQMGWPAATIYRLRRVRAEPAQVAGAGLLLVVSVSAVVIPVCIALEPILTEEFLDGAPSRVFYLAVAQIPFQLLFVVFAAIARGSDRFDLQNTARILQSVGAALAVAYVLVLGEGEVTSVLLALLVVHAATTLYLLVTVTLQTGISLRIRTSEVRDSLRFGAKAYVEVLATRVHERIDIFMIAFLLGDPAQVAFYTIAAGLVSQVRVLPESIGQAAFPQMAGQTDAESASFACKVSRNSFFLVVLMALGLAAIAPIALPLIYGPDYSASVAPFMVLLPGMVLLTVFRVLTRFFAAIDRQNANVVTQLVSTAANLILNLLWIPRYGIVGAAAASLASYGLQAVLITFVFRSVSGKGVAALLIPQREDFEAHWRRLKSVLERGRSSA